MIASDSPQNHLFLFSYGTITSQSPGSDRLRLASDSVSEFWRQPGLIDNPKSFLYPIAVKVCVKVIF